MRPTVARIHPSAIESNVRRLVALAPTAALCAVVKANGYGHGALQAARAALAGGASWLGVASLEEAAELEAGLEPAERVPILVLSELDLSAPGGAAMLASLSDRVRLTVGSPAGVTAVASQSRAGLRRVHLKVDTGMHRMGAPAGELGDVWAALGDLGALAGGPGRDRSGAKPATARAAEGIRLEGIWTHLAVADEPGNGFTDLQLDRFEAALEGLADRAGGAEIIHAANSAGLLAHPRSHHDLIRAGIACYGVAPSPALNERIELEPALELVSRVVALRTVEPGESVSYGRGWYAGEPTRLATVPIGYADGIRRDSGARGVEVLIGGRRRGIVGAVTMDQLMVETGPADGSATSLARTGSSEVGVGDEVVLIGRQGAESITASEIAQRLDTIAYEVLTHLSSRLRRAWL